MKHFEKLNNEELDFLFEGILSLKTKEDCYKFFEDLFTINEMASISQRMQVARMLKEKKTYIDIAKETGASTATISRVNRCLNYGSDGYNLVFERLYSNKNGVKE